MATRHHVGSYLAFAAAIYNVYLIRQRIIKNAIFITKSKNPRIVKGMCGIVGSLYFMGLYVLWHIPSFFSEIAVRNYLSIEDATTNYLLRGYTSKVLLQEKKVKLILEEEGLRL